MVLWAGEHRAGVHAQRNRAGRLRRLMRAWFVVAHREFVVRLLVWRTIYRPQFVALEQRAALGCVYRIARLALLRWARWVARQWLGYLPPREWGYQQP